MKGYSRAREELIEAFKSIDSPEKEEVREAKTRSSLDQVETQLEIMKLRYEKEKLAKEKLLLERKSLKSKLRETKAAVARMKDSYRISEPVMELSPPVYQLGKDLIIIESTLPLEMKSEELRIDERIDELISQYKFGGKVEHKPAQAKENLKPQIRPPLTIIDILLVSFLYVAGLLFVGIGVLRSDIFYAILGGLGIIGATLHWIKD